MDESPLLTAAEQEAAAWKRSNDEWLRQATWLARRVAALEQRQAALEAALRDVLAHPDITTEAGYAAYLRAHTLLADYATGYAATSAPAREV